MEKRLGRRRFLQGGLLSSLGFMLSPFLPKSVRAQDIPQSTKHSIPGVQILKPARVFDGEDGRIHEGWIVIVDGDRITAAGSPSELNAPGNVQITELPGMTLLPGLMDIHSHIFLHPYNETLWNDQVLKEPWSSPALSRSTWRAAC